MEIYFHFILILLAIYISNQKNLEEKMKDCIFYLSKETKTYN